MLKNQKVTMTIPIIALMLFAGTLTGCGAGLMAPDPVIENHGAEGFLDQVVKECGSKTIGELTLNELINGIQVNSQSSFFNDLTTKLYFSKISQSDYASSVNDLFPAGNNQAGLDCIFATLGDAT